MAASSTFSFHPSTLMGAGSTSPRSMFPDSVILCKAPRISELRNATSAKCKSSEGHTVEVSFWLVDPPGVSYFSVNCPGLDASHFADDMDPPMFICAEAAFVLLTVTVRGTTDHFVYTAGPAGKQSLQLLPDPNAGPLRKHPYALLPRGNEHYAVAFLDRMCIFEDDVHWLFHTGVFTSETQAWRRSRVSLQHVSESDKSLCGHHGLSKQIAVGGDSLAWVDLASGILLLQNLFDAHPVIRFIHFPKSRVRFMDEDGLPYRPDEYYCSVACCGDVIKFVVIEFDDPSIMTSGQGWRATMWNRKISWNEWRKCSTVDVADISVDQRYSALLPELRDDETKRLELKRLVFYTPVLSVHNDDFFYMMAKVNDKDDTAWVIAIDMERAAVEAMAPFSDVLHYLVTIYRSCAFPKYLNMTPGACMANPVDNFFKRLSAKQCLMQVLWTLDWLQELDQCLEIERSTYNTFRLFLQLSPVSSLHSNIGSMADYASSCNGQGEAASQAVDSCLRSLDDFDSALQEPPTCRLESIEAMRSIISDVFQALENILRVVPSTLMPKKLTPREAACHEKTGISKPSNSRAGKHHRRKKNKGRGGKGAMFQGHRRFLCFVGCLLISLIIVMSSSPSNVRDECKKVLELVLNEG